MRYHYGLAVGHAYSHSEFRHVLSTIDEVDHETNTASGSHSPVTSFPGLAQHAPTNQANPEDGVEEEALSDVDSSSDDDHSIALGSDHDSDSPLNEGSLDWDEDLIAEEMYEA